jgi:hypothetical protein
MPLSPAPDYSHPKPLILDFSLCVCVYVCVCVCVALSASACEQCRCLRRVHHGEAMTHFVFLQPTPRAQLCAGSSARCGVCARGCGACVRAQSLAFGLLLPVFLPVCLAKNTTHVNIQDFVRVGPYGSFSPFCCVTSVSGMFDGSGIAGEHAQNKIRTQYLHRVTLMEP